MRTFFLLALFFFGLPASAQNVSFFASDFTSAQGLAQLADGRVLAVDQSQGIIRSFAADGTDLGTFATLSLAWRIEPLTDGTVLVSSPAFDTVQKYASDGTSLGTFADVSGGSGMAQLADGRVLIGSDEGVLYAFDPDGTQLTPFATGFSEEPVPYQLADGRVLVTQSSARSIEAFTAAGVPLGTFATLPETGCAYSVIELADGRILTNCSFLNSPTALSQTGQVLGKVLEESYTSVIQLQDGRFLGSRASQIFAERFLSATLEGSSGFRMLSHPFAGFVSDLMRGTRTQGFPGSDDPTPADGFCSVYTYDETAGAFGEGYQCVPDATSNLAVLRGVMAYVYRDEDPATSGTQGGFPKTLTVHGDISTISSRYTLSYTDNPDLPAYQEGWHLMGNPYRLPIDWDLFSNTNVSDAVYVYDPNYLGGDYRSWSSGAAAGDLADGVIPYMQGFFVKANATAPFRGISSALVYDSEVDAYGKTETASEAPTPLRLALAVVTGGTETEASAAFVAPTEGAALGEDNIDAYRLTPGAWPRATVSTMTLGADPIPLAINALPADASGEITVPVEIAAEGYAEGPLDFVLTWTGALPDGWNAALVDRQTGERIAVETGGEVRITLDVPSSAAKATARPLGLGLDKMPPQARSFEKASSGGAVSSGDRLALVLTPASVVATGITPEAAFGLEAPAPNPASGLVQVPYTLSASGGAKVSVYDALGREVAVLASGAHSAGGHEATLDAGSLAPGVYVVRLATPEAASVRRITVVR